MTSRNSDKIVMSIGGSLIVPNGGIDSKFLQDLNKFIREQLAKNKDRQFFLITGGGMTTRHYQKAASDVIGRKLTEDDLDWIGIHSTRLNGHLLRTIFRDIAHTSIIDDYSIIKKPIERVVIGAGWKPGWSTDYDAVLVCEDYGPRTVINLSNISQVCDKDPKKYANAKPLDQVSWKNFRKIIGDKWSPGMNAPFDPIAAKKAQDLGVKVILMGKDFDNIRKYFKGENFVGTVIE